MRRYLRSRPDAAEVEAVELLIRLCRETGCRVHIVHVSSAEALPLLRRAREEGLPVTAETCPHYLTFAAEEIPDGAVAFKCAPPIRVAREPGAALGSAARGGDRPRRHRSLPCPPAMKKIEAGDFRERLGRDRVAPARAAGRLDRGAGARLHGRRPGAAGCAPRRPGWRGWTGGRGRSRPGYDADLVIWDPEASFEVDADAAPSPPPLTPYAGRTLYGVVRRTLLRGETIYDRRRVSWTTLAAGF